MDIVDCVGYGVKLMSECLEPILVVATRSLPLTPSLRDDELWPIVPGPPHRSSPGRTKTALSAVQILHTRDPAQPSCSLPPVLQNAQRHILTKEYETAEVQFVWAVSFEEREVGRTAGAADTGSWCVFFFFFP
jgi:hypothetical protein